MADTTDALRRLGWDAGFAAQAPCAEGDAPARVAAVDRDRWLLLDAHGAFRATLAGHYRHHHPRAEDLPCVGDWVCVARQAGDDLGRIHALLPRRTVLRRKVAGETADYQLIAANVDTVFVVQACHTDFNLNRLQRYLVMVQDGGAAPCIVLTKTDLVAPETLAAQCHALREAGLDVPVLPLSNLTQEGIDALVAQLAPGRTYCFVGSSGVGKSTLVNRLLGREALATAAVSGTGEGRHTTVRRELIVLDGGALLIDTPGMREFGVLGAEEGLRDSFAGVHALADACRYRDCTHGRESGCAVRAALEAGELSAAQLENFLKLREESAFNALSYAERRRKDRDFGRFLKSAKKDLDRD